MPAQKPKPNVGDIVEVYAYVSIWLQKTRVVELRRVAYVNEYDFETVNDIGGHDVHRYSDFALTWRFPSTPAKDP